MSMRLVAACAALGFAASTAFAGGPVVPVPEPVVTPAVVVPPSVGDWTGGYIGANLNYGMGKLNAAGAWGVAADGVPMSRTLAEPDGGSVALRAGYDWQFGRGVFGIGGEYNFGKYKDTFPASPFTNLPIDVTFKDVATIFLRGGFVANENFLIYGLAGYTWAKAEVKSGRVLDESRDLDGPTIGLGGEYKFSPRWSAYGEYTYTDFGTVKDTDKVKAKLGQIKIGANFRF